MPSQLMSPWMHVGVGVGVLVGVAVAVGVAVGVGVGIATCWFVISKMPRPWVAMRSTWPVGNGYAWPLPWNAMSNTATDGSPLFNGVQLAPWSVDLNTPISVPAKRFCEFSRSTTNAFTGTSGIAFVPLPPAGTHVGGAPFRLVVFQTCWPVASP